MIRRLLIVALVVILPTTVEADVYLPVVRGRRPAVHWATVVSVSDGDTIWVALERDVSEFDSWGRLVRYVWTSDGVDVGSLLVRGGFAKVAIFDDIAHLCWYLHLQEEAIAEGTDIWGPPCEYPTPTPYPGCAR